MRTALPKPLASRRAFLLSPHVAITVVLLLTSLACLPCAPSFTVRAQGSILYVNSNATEGANTGLSWVDAYVDLQQALQAAENGDEIWVAAGVYRPSVPAGREATFALKPGVALYGGFSGTETARGERDWLAHETILSGDIEGDNVYHVVSITAQGAGIVLDGFTVRDGQSYDHGAGIYCLNSSPHLANLRVTDNQAPQRGAGVYVSGGSPTLSDSEITANAAGTYGGGVFCGSANAAITRSSFRGNLANRGGALYAYTSTVVVSSSEFVGNTARYYGGALYLQQGSTTLANSLVVENHAAREAAESTRGGGLYCLNASPVVRNVTIANNLSEGPGGEGGAIYAEASCQPSVANSIIWGNTGAVSPQLSPSTLESSVSFSALQGGTVGLNNNIVHNPFPVAASGIYRLSPGSPAIDRGSNELVPTDVTTDLDGNARIFDGDGDGTAAVDMGAYEWPGHGLTVTTVGSGTVDISPPGSRFAPATLVTLTASPAPRWNFGGWSGDAEGSDSTVQVHMDAARVITATFLGPTAVTLGSFEAHSTPGGMLLQWETATESDMVGVLLRRRCAEDASWVELNGGEMLPVLEPGQLMGHRYAYVDREAVPGRRYVYQLEEVGIGALHDGTDGPYTLEVFHWPRFWLLPMLGLPRCSAP